MRVAACVPALRQTGGVERFTWHAVEELVARGHDVTLLARGNGSLRPAGTDFRQVGRRVPMSRREVARDVVTFGFRASSRRMGRRTAWYGPVGSHFRPGVVTAHAVHAVSVRKRPHRAVSAFDRAFLAIERLTYRLPHLSVTAVSPQVARDLADAYGLDEQAIAVTPPAVDAEAFPVASDAERSAARQRYGAQDAFVMGIAANYGFVPKNVLRLVEVAAELGATLLVAGTDEDAAPIVADAAKRLGADVRLLGTVRDMSDFYAALDVYALPSVYESFGMSALEAMARGTPAIVSTDCGIVSLCDYPTPDLVVPLDRPDELTRMIDELKNRSGVAPDRGARAAAWAHAQHWANVAGVLEELLAGRAA